MLLLQYNAKTDIINGEGQTPKDLAKLEDVGKLLWAAEKTDMRLKEEKLLAAAREGDLEIMNTLV